ncbi:MAG TPA: potassium transporter TrkG [Sedimentisphaerales bacterium]|nr:potassium transporter TrkG [Sedimentisphaerales bacterium]
MERTLIGVNILAAAMVTATFVLLFGFHEAFWPKQERILYALQVVLLFIFIAEKVIRRFNAVSRAEFWGANWFEAPLLIGLVVAVLGAGRWFGHREAEASATQHLAVGIYLVMQVVTKMCRTSVDWAASGRNPTRTLIASFVFLIIGGAGFLMLPRAACKDKESVRFVDALFTSTSAACVTGLTVKDTGEDFSLMGQVVILSLIQLGGLGIVVFGAVFALLLGQALSLRESVSMQDMLNTHTLSRIGNMIVFIFVGTVLIEAVGAVSLFPMWDNVPGRIADVHLPWFCSIFHSISAFCNAGFGLFSDNLVGYNRSWGVYVVVCPLIVLGGLGFGVLYDIGGVAVDRMTRFCKTSFNRQCLTIRAPKRMWLQTKIVLTVTACLIVGGMVALVFFERYAGRKDFGFLDGLFQSVTARTAGFNTVDIAAITAASKFVLILLMFIGGSPGGTAGGIKTVTLAVLIMTVIATLRKRDEVEMFGRSVRLVIVRRAITITALFTVILFAGTLALSVTERANGFGMLDVMFEASSALGTVGLSTGITPALTTGGKLIITVMMLIGRLGPLTLLASVTFNLKPARYSYPDEAIMVG